MAACAARTLAARTPAPTLPALSRLPVPPGLPPASAGWTPAAGMFVRAASTAAASAAPYAGGRPTVGRPPAFDLPVLTLPRAGVQRVLLVHSPGEVDAALQLLLQPSEHSDVGGAVVLGFDTETPVLVQSNGMMKQGSGPALLQLASRCVMQRGRLALLRAWLGCEGAGPWVCRGLVLVCSAHPHPPHPSPRYSPSRFLMYALPRVRPRTEPHPAARDRE
jgi:hypothetical protein